MSNRTDKEFLRDIIEAVHRILNYTQKHNFDTFSKDTKTQDAVIRNIEIIGEASKNVSEDYRQQHSTLPWINMIRMIDKLIHHYFGINIDIVWNVIKVEMPKLEREINKIWKKQTEK